MSNVCFPFYQLTKSLTCEKEEDVARGLVEVDLHDGDERRVQVVSLGLARVQDLHGVPAMIVVVPGVT